MRRSLVSALPALVAALVLFGCAQSAPTTVHTQGQREAAVRLADATTTPAAAPSPSPDQVCLAMSTMLDRFDCLAFIHPGLVDWLLWNAPYTPIGGTWICIREHESGGSPPYYGTYNENTGNGYFGAVQWVSGTWDNAVRGAGYPEFANGRADLAPPRVQDAAAVWLQARDGWSPWGTRWACGV